MLGAEPRVDYSLANTDMTGMVPNAEVPKYLAACDVVVLPDLTSPGGFSTAAAEAMAAGRCMIVGVGSRTDFLPLVDRQNALLVEPRSPEAIEAAVRTLAADPELRARIAAAVGEYAEQNMDYPVVASRYLEILDAVRARAASPADEPRT